MSYYVVIRPFMRSGDLEPNEHYRPWLEKYIGKQNINWDWDVESVIENTLEIKFYDSADAILFELSWK